MTSDSPQIAAIKLRYQQSFPEKAVVVAEHLEALLGDENTEIKVKDTRELLHKLAGSSGMYGYADISALCRSAMERADQGDNTALVNRLEHLRELLEQYA